MPGFNSEDLSLEIKRTIVRNGIKDDQRFTAHQWAKTLIGSHKAQFGTAMVKFLIATIAQGDFRTRSSLLESNALGAPNSVLCTSDYISHASRIMIDYSGLSEENKNVLAATFNSSHPTVFSRSATHAAYRDRDGDRVVESKGMIHGAVGQLPALFRNPTDFGVNLAIGGEGRENWVGQTIEPDGHNGHLYFHHQPEEALLMVGIEQSSPSTSMLGAVWSLFQASSDQFGQTHSLLGSSDVYTAAGSLYFSDPVYQAKLLAECHTPPPDKYDGMHVKLTNESWPLIIAYLHELDALIDASDDHAIVEKLLQLPVSAELPQVPNEIKSFISLDFKTYLKRIRLLLEEADVSVEHQQLEKTLLGQINQLQLGHKDCYPLLTNTVQKIIASSAHSIAYQDAIQRIQTLFEFQLEKDPELKSIHETVLIQQKSSELLNQADILFHQAGYLRNIYSHEAIQKDESVDDFLKKIDKCFRKLERIQQALKPMEAAVSSIDLQADSEAGVSSIENQTNLMEESWCDIDHVSTLPDIEKLQEEIAKIDHLLTQKPPLISLQVAHQLEAELEENHSSIHKLNERLVALELEKAALGEQLQNSKEQQQALSFENAEYQEKINQQARVIQKHVLGVHGLVEKLERLENNHQALLAEKEMLEVNHERLTQTVLELENQIQNLEQNQFKEKEAYQLELHHLNQTNSIQSNQIKALEESSLQVQAEKTVLGEQLQNLKAQQQALSFENVEYQKKINEQVCVIQEHALGAHRLVEKLERLENNSQVLLAEKKALEESFLQVREENIALQRHLEVLQSSNGDQIELLSRAIEGKNNEKKNLDARNRALEQLIAQQTQSIEEQAAEASQSHLEIIELQARTEAQKGQMDTLNVVCLKQTEKIRLLELEKETLVTRVQALEGQQQTVATSQRFWPEMLAPVYMALREIQYKAEELKLRGQINAAACALKLHEEITQKIQETFVDKVPTQESIRNFKTGCKESINQANASVLGQQRGWKRLLGNFAACIAGLFIGYLIAGSINYCRTGQFTFFNTTDSQKKANALGKEVDNLNDGDEIFGLPSKGGA